MDKKTLLAFLLIAVVLILMPYYIKLVAPQEEQGQPNDVITTVPAQQAESPSPEPQVYSNTINNIVARPLSENIQQYASEQIVAIESVLYSAKVSNRNGGSFTSFLLNKYKAADTASVQLVDNFNKNNLLFEAISVDGIPLILSEPWNLIESARSVDVSERSKSIKFSTVVLGKTITKTLTFEPNSYQIGISFDLSEIKDQLSQGLYSLSWTGGLPATEKNLKDELFYYKAYVYQGD